MEHQNENGVCPHCGYCKHCGRGGHQIYPIYPIYPLYPSYPTPYYEPYWGTIVGDFPSMAPTVTSGSSTGTTIQIDAQSTFTN